MALSRMALLLIAPLAASPARAAPVTAEQAIEIHRRTFEPVAARLDCPEGEDGEIVVCARREEVSPYRYTGPVAREPGAYVPGEPRGVGPECMRLCLQPVGIDLNMVLKVVEGIKRHLESDR
jgi:hypothetical protein